MFLKFLKKIKRFFVRIKNKIRNRLFPTAIILTYHRVASPNNDPHELSVSPENFSAQMEYLKNNFNVISLDELLTKLEKRTLEKNTIVITFDDGYADNLYNALPILELIKVPATFFIASKYIGTESYYWDSVSNELYSRPMTAPELEVLSRSPFAFIGGHTVSHPHMPTLNPQQQKTEIEDDKAALTSLLKKEINTFSFPFGEFNRTSIQAVKNAGYKCACILNGKRITARTNKYRLTRFVVRNWDSDTLKQNIDSKFL